MTVAYLMNLAVNGAVEGLLVGLLALAVTLVFGVARFPNASAGDVAMVGAYSGWLLQSAIVSLGPLSLVFAGATAMASAALVSLALYWLVFRALSGRVGVYALIASIGAAFVLRSVVTFFLGHDQQVFAVPLTRALSIGPLRVLPIDLWVGAIALAAMVCVFVILRMTAMGRRMRAIADNPQLAMVSGIPAARTMSGLWLMAGALSGLAGCLLGLKTVIAPEMGWDLLLPAFAATILGSVGNPLGAVIGGVIIGIAQEVSTPFVGFTYKIAIGFVVMLLVLLVRPEGLFVARARVR